MTGNRFSGLIAAWDEIFQWQVRIVSIAAGNSAATVLTAIRKSRQVAQAATASRRAASGNNDRLYPRSNATTFSAGISQGRKESSPDLSR